MTDFYEELGITAAEREAFNASARECCGVRNDNELVEQLCKHGNCIELICVCGENTGGWGPVGCPCQDEGSV